MLTYKLCEIYTYLPTYLPLSVRFGSCPWSWVIAGVSAAFDWSIIKPARPPNSLEHPQMNLDSKTLRLRTAPLHQMFGKGGSVPLKEYKGVSNIKKPNPFFAASAVAAAFD